MTGPAPAVHPPFDGLHLFAVTLPHAVWARWGGLQKIPSIHYCDIVGLRCQKIMKPRDILGRNGP